MSDMSKGKDRFVAPDIFLHCDRCGSEWMMLYPKSPNHPYRRTWRELHEHLCPNCLEELEREEREGDDR